MPASKKAKTEQPHREETQAENLGENLNKNRFFVSLQVLQGITFIACVYILLLAWVDEVELSPMGTWTWFLIGIYVVYIGLQVYSIIKYGFGNSFTYLKVFGKFILKNRGR